MFNVLLKELRAQNGLTQGQLAKAAGVSPGNVGDWESGKSKPGYNALASLARIFDVSADYLLELTPEKTSERPDELQRLVAVKVALLMVPLLPEEEREDVFDIVHLKYKRRVEKKRESIYWTYFEESTDGESGPAGDREARDGTA